MEASKTTNMIVHSNKGIKYELVLGNPMMPTIEREFLTKQSYTSYQWAFSNTRWYEMVDGLIL